MQSTGHPATGVVGQPSEADSNLLRGLVDHLRQKRPELRQEWASRLTDAQLLERAGPKQQQPGGRDPTP